MTFKRTELASLNMSMFFFVYEERCLREDSTLSFNNKPFVLYLSLFLGFSFEGKTSCRAVALMDRWKDLHLVNNYFYMQRLHPWIHARGSMMFLSSVVWRR